MRRSRFVRGSSVLVHVRSDSRAQSVVQPWSGGSALALLRNVAECGVVIVGGDDAERLGG